MDAQPERFDTYSAVVGAPLESLGVNLTRGQMWQQVAKERVSAAVRSQFYACAYRFAPDGVAEPEWFRLLSFGKMIPVKPPKG
jgi:hypothetical protein